MTSEPATMGQRMVYRRLQVGLTQAQVSSQVRQSKSGRTLSRNTYKRAELASWRASGGPGPERFGYIEKLILKIVVILLVIGMGLWLYTLMKKAPEKK